MRSTMNMLFKTRYDLPSWDFNAVSLERITGLLHCVCRVTGDTIPLWNRPGGLGPSWVLSEPSDSEISWDPAHLQRPWIQSDRPTLRALAHQGTPRCKGNGKLVKCSSLLYDSLHLFNLFLNSLGFRKLPSADLLMQSQVDHSVCFILPWRCSERQYFS